MAKLQMLLIIAGCPVESKSKVYHRGRKFLNYLAGLRLNSRICGSVSEAYLDFSFIT